MLNVTVLSATTEETPNWHGSISNVRSACLIAILFELSKALANTFSLMKDWLTPRQSRVINGHTFRVEALLINNLEKIIPPHSTMICTYLRWHVPSSINSSSVIWLRWSPKIVPPRAAILAGCYCQRREIHSKL